MIRKKALAAAAAALALLPLLVLPAAAKVTALRSEVAELRQDVAALEDRTRDELLQGEAKLQRLHETLDELDK